MGYDSSDEKSMTLNSTLILTAVYAIGLLSLSFAFMKLCRKLSVMRSRRLENGNGAHELNGPTTTGLDPAAIASLPTQIYKSSATVEGDEDASMAPECSVCLAKLEEGEELRLLPKCLHTFHVACVDTWLASHSTCPNCRTSVGEAPTSPTEVEEAPPPSGSREVVVQVQQE